MKGMKNVREEDRREKEEGANDGGEKEGRGGRLDNRERTNEREE